MNDRLGHPIAAILALVAAAVCCLCCKPAWSPKGDQVAYISVQNAKDQGQWAVTIYDLATKQSRVVAETKATDDSVLVPMAVFWPKRGHELTYVSAPGDDKKECVVQVSTCCLRTGRTKSSERIAVPDVSVESGFGPVFLQGTRWLWLTSGPGCFRVALKKGEAAPLTRSKAPLMSGGKVFYVGEGPEKAVEFGRIRTFPRLRERPLFVVRPEKGEELSPLVGIPSDCIRFACIAESETGKRLRIYDKRGRCLKTIPLPEQTEVGDPPSAEWTPDGGTVWLTLKGTDAGVEYSGLAEIRVADGTIRIIKINVNKERGDLAPFQVALSPTGKCLAVEMGSEERAELCLVALAGDMRSVTFVPPPATLAAPKPGGAG